MKKLSFIVFTLIFTFISSLTTNLDLYAAELIQYDLKVDGMTCPFCLASSESALKKIDGVERISSNLETGTISVCGPVSLEFDEQELGKLFTKKGFTYRHLSKSQSCSLVENAS